MPCECLEIITADNYPANDAQSDLNTYRSNHNEVLAVTATELRFVDENSEGALTPHYYARFRFETQSLSQLRDDAESWMSANFDWWAWRHHTCQHDPQTGASEGSRCPAPQNWPNQNTSGNVPADVIAHYT